MSIFPLWLALVVKRLALWICYATKCYLPAASTILKRKKSRPSTSWKALSHSGISLLPWRNHVPRYYIWVTMTTNLNRWKPIYNLLMRKHTSPWQINKEPYILDEATSTWEIYSIHSSSLVLCTFNASHLQKRFACCRRKKSDDFKTSTWWTHTSPKLEKRETNQLPLFFWESRGWNRGRRKVTVSKNGTYWRWILREEQRNRNQTRAQTRFLTFAYISFPGWDRWFPTNKSPRTDALSSEQKGFTQYEHVQNKHQLLHSLLIEYPRPNQHTHPI